MSRLSSLLFSILIVISSTTASAVTVIDEMMMPAWVLSEGESTPAKPGMALNPGDEVLTGVGARVYIKLSEGSTIKLGENAQFKTEAILEPIEETGVFDAVFNVLKGAFRYTTNTLLKSRRRNIDFRIGTVTAGIRGTDIWGSSDSFDDLVCLIEGNIEVKHIDGVPLQLTEPLDYFSAEKNKPANPVGKITEEELNKWAQKTEISSGFGVISASGVYAVNLLSVSKFNSAEKAQSHFSKAGYTTDIKEIEINGRKWYRLRIEGFKTRQDAAYFSDYIAGQFGTTKPWVGRF